MSYKDVLDDIDIQYKTLPNKVKETIVLKNNKYSKINFIAETNLELEMEGKCIIVSKNGKKVFELEAPYMEDSEGKINNNIYYHIVNHGDHYDIELNLDSDWLNSLDIKYPVYVDPTISNSNNEITLEETYIYPGDTNDIRHNKEYFKCGVERVNGVDRQNIGLLRFSLPNFGTGSAILKAELTLTPYKAPLSGADDKFVEIHKILQDWNVVDANWSNMAGKFDDRIDAVCAFSRSPIYDNVLHLYKYKIDITKLVKTWYEDSPNYGFMIKSCNTNYIDDQFQMYFSKENSLSANAKPVISITYKNFNGIESHLDYKTHDLTRGSSSINTYNGNVTNIFNIASTIGGRLPIGANLIYNTNDIVLNNKSFFGKGFKLNFEEKIIVESSNTIEYHDEDGTIHYLKRKEESSELKYCDEDGLGLEVIKTDTQCIMTDIEQNKKIFSIINNKYYLSKVIDSDNNFIDIILNEDGSIDKIKDKNGKTVRISYENNKITLFSENGSTILNYDNDLLKSIVFDIGTIYIDYNSNSIISSILDTNGLKLVYDYYGNLPYKIKTVTQYGINNMVGKYYTLRYSYDSTEITDNVGIKEILTYNEYGNVKSRNTLKGMNEVYSAYSREKTFGTGNNKNKILSDMIPFRYTKNYLKNSSFETDENNFTIEEGIVKSFDNTKYRTGDRSLKIVATKENKSIVRNVKVAKDNYYTFSGYFVNNTKAFISLSYEDNNGNYLSEIREILPSENFEREDVTIFYSQDAKSDLIIKVTFQEKGIVYIDDIQLENEEVANNYNMFENSDFSEGLEGWDKAAYLNDGTPVNVGNSMSIETINEKNEKALKIVMNPLKITEISKKFDVKGTVDDVFTLSFWYKNEGIMPFEPSSGCTVRINFEPYDTDYGQCLVIVPLPVTGEGIWQHYTHREGPPSNFKSITVTFAQYASANDFFLTNLSFYKNIASEDYEYDEYGNIISVTESSKDSNKFNYDSKNQLIKMTTPLGKNFMYEYDKNKPLKLLSAISDSGICNEIKYDSNDNPISTKISKKIMTDVKEGNYKIRCKGTRKYLKAEYNNVLLEESECSNTVWKLQCENDKCKFLYSMLPNYSISHFKDNIILSLANENNEFFLEKTNFGSFYIYTKNKDNMKKYLKANDYTLELNNLNSDDSTFEFYIENADEMFIETNANYSDDGRYITDTTTTNMTTEKYEIDEISGLRTALYSKGQKYSYKYNNKNQLISVKNNDKVVSYEYNTSNLLKKIDVGNKVYNLEYNEFLEFKSLKIGDDLKLMEKNFDSISNKVTSVSYANGNIISCSYDGFDRLEQLSKSDNMYLFKYDNNNNIAKIRSENNTKRYRYDIVNKLYEYDFDDMRINYKYDKDNNIISKFIKLGKENYSIEKEVNLDDDLEKLTINSENKIHYQYDNLCRLSSRSINNSFQTYYSYKSNGKRAKTLIDTVENNNDKYRYNYDEYDNIKQIFHNGNLLYEYDYDEYNQLITEKNYSKNTKIEYVYDLYGNIMSKTEKLLLDNSVQNIINYLYENNSWKDQLTGFNNEIINYDESGNPIRIGNNKILTWKNGKELATYNDGIVDINYTYDEIGIRTCKKINNESTYYYLEGNKIIFEKTGDDTIFYIRSGEEIIGFEYKNNCYYYIKNAQDDVIGILDNNYNKIVEYNYDAWGNITGMIDNSGINLGKVNPIRYRSYYYDKETNLYYLNSRYYNPEWGRFLNADDSIGFEGNHIGYNMYVYASNDPINNVDSSGNLSFKQIKKTAKKIQKKTTKFVNKAVSSTKKTAKKIITNALTATKNACKILKDAFVFEFGSGVGVGAGTQFGPVKAETGWTKKFGTGLNKDGSYQYTTQELDLIDIEVFDNNFGWSREITSYDPAMNPMATVYDLLKDPDVEITSVARFNELPDYTVETEKCFIGLNISIYCILGFDIKIGFDL